MAMNTICPHLWFDKEAKEAATFYTGIFPRSKITNVTTLEGTPGGDADVVSLELAGHPFVAISAGPLFKFNPSISFIVNFDPSKDKDAKKHLDQTWKKLAEGGTALMPLDKYPFSERYGWIQDKYGLSWQLMLTDPRGDPRPFLTPLLMFTGPVAGKAEEATDFYLSVFKGSQRGQLRRYPAGSPTEKEGTVMFTGVNLAGTWVAAMDSSLEHRFAFNEAISLMVRCKDQKEIDHYWKKLSAVPEAEQCGWLKDKYGVSWQVTPVAMDSMLRNGTKTQIKRVTEAFLPMKKFDLAALEKAYRGEARTPRTTSRDRAKPKKRAARHARSPKQRPSARTKR
jgi:predicted 3-demethylubiquinone-9 3-methyltransferase (glyoxalase superfamily)